MERHIEALRETRKLLNRAEVEKTIELMERAEQIFFFGVWEKSVGCADSVEVYEDYK